MSICLLGHAMSQAPGQGVVYLLISLELIRRIEASLARAPKVMVSLNQGLTRTSIDPNSGSLECLFTMKTPCKSGSVSLG